MGGTACTLTITTLTMLLASELEAAEGVGGLYSDAAA